MSDTRGPAAARRVLWVSLVLAALCCSGLALLAAWWLARAGPQMMVVTTVDSKGNMIGVPQLHFDPPPTRIPSRGLSRLPAQLQRLKDSSKQSPSLGIFTPDEQRGFGVSRRSGRFELAFVFDTRTGAKQERAVRTFFAKLGGAPTEDYLASNGGVANATRILTYPAPTQGIPLTEFCTRIFRDIYKVSDEEGLTFTFSE